jgi:hypothetical protein
MLPSKLTRAIDEMHVFHAARHPIVLFHAASLLVLVRENGYACAREIRIRAVKRKLQASIPLL